MEISDTTPRETYTIAGKQFSIPQPYVEGHVMTAGEASQLNQVLAENLRNNLAKDVKDAETNGTFDQEQMQSVVDDYCAEYEMGVRTSSGREVDPVRREAITIMVEKVRKAVQKQQGSLKGVKAGDIRKRAVALLDDTTKGDKYKEVWDVAKQRVESQREIADIEL